MMKWTGLAKRWTPRSSAELRGNGIYPWTNRIVWLLIEFFMVLALLLSSGSQG